MCGRFSLGTTATSLASQFHLPESLAWAPRYNLTPSQEILAVVQPPLSAREFRRLRWGLIPSWATDQAIGARLINARAETVAAKPAFRTPLRERRCLILADAFYEWRAQGRQKLPWCIRMRDGRPFAFAGLRDCWIDSTRVGIESCAIITTTPDALVSPIHHRMPVILEPAAYDPWLDTTLRNPERILPLLRPHPSDAMTAYPVSPRVNNPTFDVPSCLERLEEVGQGDLSLPT
jgi:putative SOS response-associated peptidase YedK